MFVGASALCGASWSIGSLIAFRVIQGIGGGMMTPVGMAMLFRAFPPNERAQASAVLFAPTFIAPTLGPIFGGWLVTDVDWRLIFYINLPIGILGLLFTFFFVEEHTEPASGRFDPRGFVLSGLTLVSLLFALARGPTKGWTSPTVVGPGVTGLVLLAALVYVEVNSEAPMLALRLLRDRMFRNSMLAAFMSTASLLGVLFLLPLYLQQLRGLSALQAGLATFPAALGMVVMLQVTSRIYPRVGPRRMMIFGLTGATFTSAAFLFVGLNTSLWWIRAIMLFRGVFMSFAMLPMQAASFSTISPRDTGRASSLFSTNRQVASSVGVALLATVLVQRTKDHLSSALAAAGGSPQSAVAHATLSAFHDAFFVATILALFGVASAFLIRDEDAAASMRPPTPASRPVEAEAAS
jgi:EmrB/QacA subfamily drug resistance transporter